MIQWVIALIILVICLYLYKNELQVKTLKSSPISRGKPVIGIVSDWDRKGVPYQSRFLSKCLSARFNVQIFAYNAYVRDEADWGYKGLVFTKIVKPWKLINWIKKNNIKVVFFPDRLEDERVLDWCKKNKIATVMIINYETIAKEDFPALKKYTKLWCPVKCTQGLLKSYGFKNTSFIRWGIDNEMFRPGKINVKYPVRFFHNAGWGGVEWRKNTQAVVEAFDIATRKNRNINLVIKTQKPLFEYPEHVKKIVHNNGYIQVIEKDMGLADLIVLYLSCNVSILPSKWEGIGIPFIESLAMGHPIITVDAPPMNEWVRDSFNGLCAKVARWQPRVNRKLLVKGALVDVDGLAKRILDLSDPNLIKRMSVNAVKSVRKSKKEFSRKALRFTDSLC